MSNIRYELKNPDQPGLTYSSEALAKRAVPFYCETFGVRASTTTIRPLYKEPVTQEGDPTFLVNLEAATKLIRNDVHGRLTEKNAKPIDCPVCTTQLKIYKRKLHSGIVRGLLLMYKFHRENPQETWIPISKDAIPLELCTLFHHFEHEKLPFWELAEKKNDRNDARNIKGGFWRLTKRGLNFAENKETAWKHVLVYLNSCVGHADEEVTVQQALEDSFDYFQLINASLDELIADEVGNSDNSRFKIESSTDHPPDRDS